MAGLVTRLLSGWPGENGGLVVPDGGVAAWEIDSNASDEDLRDVQARVNWLNPDSRWVMLDVATGRTKIVPNSQVDARKLDYGDDPDAVSMQGRTNRSRARSGTPSRSCRDRTRRDNQLMQLQTIQGGKWKVASGRRARGKLTSLTPRPRPLTPAPRHFAHRGAHLDVRDAVRTDGRGGDLSRRQPLRARRRQTRPQQRPGPGRVRRTQGPQDSATADVVVCQQPRQQQSADVPG